MAIELGSGYVSIVPSARGFGRALGRELGPHLDAAGRDASEGFGKRFVGGLRGVTLAAGRLLAGVGVAAGAGFAAAGAFGLKAAADFEQVRISFEGILGSAEKAQSTLNDLRKFAAKTPFEFPELTRSAKQLLAVGFSAGDVIPIMTKLGNTAATLGVGGVAIEGVVRALGQMKGKGKASAQELNQISEQIPGFSAVGAIAQSMGITTAKAFKLMEKGAIPADKAIAAILAGMERFPGAAGAMDRQSKTLNGVLSTFKDTVRDALINGIEPFLPAISNGLTKAMPVIQQAVAGAVGGIVRLVRAIGPLVATVKLYGEQFIASFRDGAYWVDGPFAAVSRLGALFRQVYDFVAANLKPILIGLGITFLALTSPISAAFAALLLLYAPASKILAVVGAVATAVAARLVPVLQAVARFVVDTLVPAIVSFGEFLSRNKEILIGLAAGLSVLLIPAIALLVASFIWWATSAAIAAAATIAAALPVIALVAAVALLVTAALYVWKNWDQIWKWIKDATAAAARWIGDRVGDVVDFFIRLPGRILGAVTGFQDLLVEKGKQLVIGLLNAIGNKAVDLWDFLTGLPGRVLDAVGDLGATLFKAGKDLVQGLIDGIKSQAGRLAGIVGNLATGNVVGAAREALKMRSPSRVFMDIGAAVGEGLALGIEGSAGRVLAATSRLVPAPVYRTSAAAAPVASVASAPAAPQFAQHIHVGAGMVDEVALARMAAREGAWLLKTSSR